MLFFQDAIVEADYPTLDQIMKKLTRGKPPIWTRAPDKEVPLPANVQPASIALRWRGDKRVPSAVASIRQEPMRIRVSNILRDDREDLKHQDYNYLVEGLAHDVLFPAAKGLDARTTLTAAERPITDWISARCEELLLLFSRNANRWALHTTDENRWIAFLITYHNENNDDSLTPEILVKWLVEEGRWPEEPASNLGRQYEFSRRLLKAYDDTATKRR